MNSAIAKKAFFIDTELSACCRCLSLRTGTIIIGALHLICGAAFLITTSLVEPLTADIPHVLYRSNNWYAESLCSILVRSIIIGTFSYMLVWVVVAILLIIGGVQNNASYVFPSVCLGFGNLAAQFATFVGCFAILLHYNNMTRELIGTLLAAFGVLLPLQLYMWLVILSYYKKLVAAYFGYDSYGSADATHQKSVDLGPPKFFTVELLDEFQKK